MVPAVAVRARNVFICRHFKAVKPILRECDPGKNTVERVPVDVEGSSGVNRKKLRGETTRTCTHPRYVAQTQSPPLSRYYFIK